MLYLFAEYSLSTKRRELRRGSAIVPIQPQVFDLLEYLLRHRERVVTKEDLLEVIWKGRIISESGLTSRISAARTAIGDSGEKQELIRTSARKGIRFVGDVTEQEEDESTEPAGTSAVHEAPLQATEAPTSADKGEQPPATRILAQRPSLAVLPFANMSGDPEQEYFADGVVEDITTALSRFRSFVVISRNSSFMFKGRSIDIKQVARELDVRYILEGSIRKAADKVRITGQLVDAETGGHLWAGKYDGALGDVFALQDTITASVAAAIEPHVMSAEIARATRKGTSNLVAYDYCLQARACTFTPTAPSIDEALQLVEKAIELDPTYAQAWMIRALCLNFRFVLGLVDDIEPVVSPQLAGGAELDAFVRTTRAVSHAEAARYGRQAVACDRDDPEVLAVAGYLLALEGDHIGAADLHKRALALNPHSNSVCAFGGWVEVMGGEIEAAIPLFEASLLLDPLSPEGVYALAGLSAAHFFLKRFDEAITWGRRAIARHPHLTPSYRFLAASLAHAGRIEEAQTAISALLARQPKSSLARSRYNPFRHAWMLDLYLDGLRLAGMPE